MTPQPTVIDILGLLDEAGDAGLPSGVIWRSFSWPPEHQRRAVLVNQLLKGLLVAVVPKVRKSAVRERSAYYRGASVYRWWITPGGREWLAAKRDRAALAERRDRAARDRRIVHDTLSKAAFGEYTALRLPAGRYGSARQRAQRNELIYRYRGMGLTLGTLAAIAGLSRERVRQICIEEEAASRRMLDWVAQHDTIGS